MLISMFTDKTFAPAILILLQLGIQPQASKGHNGGYHERWLDGNLDNSVLSCVIQPSCQCETKISLTLLLCSDP